jgi:gliding motility-associated-like protein
VVANDQGSASTVTVLSGPNHGSVQSISGGVVNYMPNQGYYGQDSLYYSICDNFCVNRCDTALVVITIEQDIPIDIPNGFTPNGDGFNDFFFIVGLHQYPNNKITIFNRWGDKVFAAEPYQNNWDGTSSNTALKISGDKVVDGTYFFILDLGDGSEPITGFVELKTR